MGFDDDCDGWSCGGAPVIVVMLLVEELLLPQSFARPTGLPDLEYIHIFLGIAF